MPPTRPRPTCNFPTFHSVAFQLLHPLLAPIAALTGPPSPEVAALASRFRRREVARGEAWLREGEVCRRLFFLESGLMRHIRTEPDGQVRTRWATLPGQYGLDFPSFSRQTPSDSGIEAAKASVIHELDYETWARLRVEHPQLQAFWGATLEYLVACFEDRVYSLISGDAERRYGYMMERYPDFLLQLPQHYVADMLGIAPRHLSRVRGAKGRKSDTREEGRRSDIYEPGP